MEYEAFIRGKTRAYLSKTVCLKEVFSVFNILCFLLSFPGNEQSDTLEAYTHLLKHLSVK